ncbi:hypothetical protein O181_022635 [Austropuccinia psidii MF-1]|uniref:Uncharacterized protein n=1 Tax=Austropuccinia psidii MF-1 TaxID=1389203 RepID=A0A9Q3GYA3_9BASI|nr:hypothetical protein [Austropuccinia psidii MF-1]
MRNHKLLNQLPGELEHAVKLSFNKDCTLDYIANTLQEVRKRKDIVNYFLYRSKVFEEKKLFMVDNKDKPRDKVAEVPKKKNSCHNCGSTDHYANNYPKEKKMI